jgi:hypothetical protein
MLSSVYSLSWIKYRTVCIANAGLSMKVENMFLSEISNLFNFVGKQSRSGEDD